MQQHMQLPSATCSNPCSPVDGHIAVHLPRRSTMSGGSEGLAGQLHEGHGVQMDIAQACAQLFTRLQEVCVEHRMGYLSLRHPANGMPPMLARTLGPLPPSLSEGCQLPALMYARALPVCLQALEYAGALSDSQGTGFKPPWKVSMCCLCRCPGSLESMLPLNTPNSFESPCTSMALYLLPGMAQRKVGVGCLCLCLEPMHPLELLKPLFALP